ncbi:toxic anion resistance protein [Marinococcus halophilus]|uniref:Tellurite resistance protein n=1 Tax=Marinococcus halophilus TaxID=1371 RepID=A0A510Y5S4_MARHA|nr:toxic anion resistance protein [Marinococcus halophilus]OZT80795.1 toxic anion resistance protein [Marinococcus halophilus]GEK57847.1 tellurite resistance protein [Marinococcus halophilus]
MTDASNTNQEDLTPSTNEGKSREEAEKFIERFKNEKDSDQLVSTLGGLGETEQRKAGDSLEALKRPVREMMDQKDNELPDKLHELKTVVGELEPEYLKEGRFQKTLNKILRRDPVEQYAKKYETVESQVDNIIHGLLAGRDKLQEDNVMLEELRETAIKRIEELETQIETGKQLNAMLEEEMLQEEWRDNPAAIQKGQQKVISRVKNMAQAVMVLQQSIASIDLIVDNNGKLEEAIFNAITMTKNIVTVTASIQLALGNQRKVINAVQSVNESTENMLTNNARMLKENTADTLKTLEEPAIALETFQQAYQDVYEAIQMTEQSNERIVASSKQFISEMDELNNQMKHKLLN